MRNSKLIVAAAVAISAIAGIDAASAADLAARPYTKAAPIMVAMYDWSGFYIGANAGYGSSRECFTRNTNTIVVGAGLGPGPFVGAPDSCVTPTGGVAGGQVGYRWQSSAWVFGLEAQGDWANLRASTPSIFLGGGNQISSQINGLGLFTGQVGYAWNNVLLYVKGGAAVVSDRYQHLTPAPANVAFDQATETRWGGTVGVGLEYGFTPNWSVAVEYDHLFMGTRDINFYTLPGFGVGFNGQERIRQDVDMVTARINYKFGGPVVARY